MIENKYIPPGLSKKLLSNAKGPYKIIRLFPNQTAEIQINKKLVKYHTNFLKPYFSFYRVESFVTKKE